jgi:hypothetical protein
MYALLQGHALDGNNRSKGTYNLKIQGFLMCVKMGNIALAIMMQDPLHVGKKLGNLLLSTIKVVFWGKYM